MTVQRVLRQGRAHNLAAGQHGVDVDTGAHAHGFEHEHQILGHHIAAGAWREGTAAEAGERAPNAKGGSGGKSGKGGQRKAAAKSATSAAVSAAAVFFPHQAMADLTLCCEPWALLPL